MGTEHLDQLIFGIHPVQEALRSGQKLERLYISSGRKNKALAAILKHAKAQGVDVRFEPWKRLTARLGKRAAHQGVVARTAGYPYASFETLAALAHQQSEPPLLVLLDCIQDPHNFGAILRSAECAGAHGVIIPKQKSVSVTPTVMKAAAGAAAHLPICRVTNLVAAMTTLQQQGIWLVGTAGAASQTYTELDWTMPVALVIGNEEKGLRRLVAEHCDFMVSIPLSGKVASLNAAVASGIVLFEARRQRNLQPMSGQY